MDDLHTKPLAFSSDSNLISSSHRLPFTTKDGTVLNVEVFDEGTDNASPLLLAIHGICASAETLGIQKIVSLAKDKSIKVAVLELEGHGFSTGKRGVCTDFDRILNHVLEFVRITVPRIRQDGTSTTLPYFLLGNSFGGILSIYAANEISVSSSTYPSGFKGVVPIAPAVGINPTVVPPLPVVQVLRVLAWLAPSAQTPFTPVEDPSTYNCPSNSIRNFSGHWPLSTSKMLLDVTSKQVPEDVSKGKLALEQVENVLLVSGVKDIVIPIQAVEMFYNGIKSENRKFIKVPNAGHDLMFHNSSAKFVTEAIMDWVLKIHRQEEG